MNKPPILCDKCDSNFSCLLDYDGENCRKTRSIEPTNGDRIRAMMDEELAEWCVIFARCPDGCNLCSGLVIAWKCKKCWLDWLKQEATE